MLKSGDTYLWPALMLHSIFNGKTMHQSHIRRRGHLCHDVGFHFNLQLGGSHLTAHDFPSLRCAGMTIELQLSGQVQLTQTITKSPKSGPKVTEVAAKVAAIIIAVPVNVSL